MQTVYFYVPRKTMPSIRTHGYLSVGAYHRVFGRMSNSTYVKYEQQMEDATKEFPALQKKLDAVESKADKQLCYLDWRTADVLPSDKHGSEAIYALYFPIPNEPDIIKFVRDVRDFAFGTYVLCSARIRCKTYPINGDVSEAHQSDRAYWVKRWRAQMKGKDSDPLWFAGIPHIFFVPPDGLVPAGDITQQSLLFT